MKTSERILRVIRAHGQVRPHDLALMLQITPAAIHRQLKKLCERGVIERVGRPPTTFYQEIQGDLGQAVFQLSSEQLDFLQEHYLYVSPTGVMVEGAEGLFCWAKDKRQQMAFPSLVGEYIEGRVHANKFQGPCGIDANERFQGIFSEVYLEQVYYKDFYSLPKYGRTKTGQLVLYGKQAQSRKIIHRLAKQCRPLLESLLKEQEIELLAWVPHSLPRQIPFLKEFEHYLSFDLHKIDIVKAYSGEFPVAQKTLSKLEERMANASRTMVVKPLRVPHKNILLIDDAVGSGATLYQVAKKLLDRGARKVVGFAIAGSYKGFEVIREI